MKARGLVPIIFILSTFTLFSQVKIKEKVEIKPGPQISTGLLKSNDLNSMNSLPCNAHFTPDSNHYYQLVFGGYWGSLDPAQQMFNLQNGFNVSHQFLKYKSGGGSPSGFPYSIEIIEGQQYCRLEKLVLKEIFPEGTGWWEWINTNSYSLQNISYFYLHGGEPDSLHLALMDTASTIWEYNGVPHYEPSYYRIVYDYPLSGTANVTYRIIPVGLEDHPEEYLYLHTTIIWRNFFMEGEQTIDYDQNELQHGHEWELQIRPITTECRGSVGPIDSTGLNFEYEAGGWIPPDTRFYVAITEGSEYGVLKLNNSGSNVSSTFFMDLNENDLYCLNFIANGIVPDTAGVVKINVIPSEPRILPIELNLRVVQNYSNDYPIHVTLIPSKISPGDTASILLERRNFDGSYTPFDSTQIFNIELVQGQDYGRLLSGNDTSDYFYNWQAPFKFIASGNINTDSVAAWIKVTTIISAEQASSPPKKTVNENVISRKNDQIKSKFIEDALPVIDEKKHRVKNIARVIKKNKPREVEDALPITKKKKDIDTKPNLLIIIAEDEEIFGWGKAVIKRPEIVVTLDPDTLSPGDTADVILQFKKADGTLIPFKPEQLVEIGVIGGCENGLLLRSDGKDSLYFKDILQPIRYVAADNISPDDLKVKIRVGIPTSANYNNLKKKKSNLPVIESNYCTPEYFVYPYFGIGDGVLKQFEILLGETKYYFAYEDPDDNSKLLISSNKDPNFLEPWPGLIKDDAVWGNNPVSFISGKKDESERNILGVYWEKRKPNGQILPSGLIRLIGRYWERDLKYKVKLNASYRGRNGSIEIEVKKPIQLGNGNSYATDVFGHENINIDEYCFKYGGMKGIPPQLIKAQMYKESSDYLPKWRYEPWVDINYQVANNWVLQDNFVVTETSMGQGNEIPLTHINLDVMYPRNQKRIYNIIADNLTTRYFNRNDMRCTNYSGADITDRFRYHYNLLRTRDKKDRDVINEALDLLKQDLKNNIPEFSQYNRIAQTRIVASYGLVQQTYYDAVRENKTQCLYVFDIHDGHYPPELLNEYDYFMPAYCDRIYRNIGNSIRNESEWNGSYERIWRNYEETYNSGEPGYVENVMQYYNQFLPK